MSFFLGLDLGQASDYTALVVLHRVEVPTGEVADQERRQPVTRIGADGADVVERRTTTRRDVTRTEYHVRHLHRYDLGTPYPDVVRHVESWMSGMPRGTAELVVDKTGVGAPVVDMFREGGIQNLTAVTITGGTSPGGDGQDVTVPKRDLVTTVQRLMHEGVLRAAEGLTLWPVLREELQTFKAKISLDTALG